MIFQKRNFVQNFCKILPRSQIFFSFALANGSLRAKRFAGREQLIPFYSARTAFFSMFSPSRHLLVLFWNTTQFDLRGISITLTLTVSRKVHRFTSTFRRYASRVLLDQRPGFLLDRECLSLLCLLSPHARTLFSSRSRFGLVAVNYCRTDRHSWENVTRRKYWSGNYTNSCVRKYVSF